MIKKLKYKIWKHLTKEIIPVGALQEAVISTGFKRYSGQPIMDGTPDLEHKKTSYPGEPEHVKQDSTSVGCKPKIIAIQGLLYSGSSTLVCFFQEFDNMIVIGNSEPAWAKRTSLSGHSTECKFFAESGFIDMVKAFKREAPGVINARVRKFIYNFNRAYTDKKITPYEELPDLYNDTFKAISQELLLEILDLDEHTREYMRNHTFPHATYEDNDASYDSCNFMKGTGKGRCVFYQFADLTEEVFNHYISDYLEKFFSIISGKEFVVYDQSFPRDILEFINNYLQTPIKQIVVTRDPRDQFLSADKKDYLILPQTARGFKNNMAGRVASMPEGNPNRMVLRYEDFVLNYDVSKKRIMEFVGLKSENHVAPKSVFDPSISVENIGTYRHYHRQDFIQEIEKEMSEQCFYPERENLSDEAIRLLKSSGNWDDQFSTF